MMSTVAPNPEDSERAVRAPTAPGRRRRWQFRLAAVLLGLSPMLAFEGLCRVCDWGRPALHDDPFVGFQSVRPLFVLSDDGAQYEVPKSRQVYFCAESFPSRKTAETYRIFCLGGSTVQGRPFAVETSFTSWLEISLRAAQPDTDWDVINCGGVSYASYRLLPIMQEVLSYEPDLIILCTGHNEFLESRTFDHLAARGEVVNRAIAAASKLRTFTLIREQYLRARGKSSEAPPEGRPLLPTEVDALLDYRNGLENYIRDDEWRNGVIEQFRYNLVALVRTAQDAGVPILVVNPASNLRDCPPFKSLHRDDLTASELEQWDALCSEADRHLDREHLDRPAAIDCLQQACRIDPQYAATFYRLGHCYLETHRNNEALEMFERARDLDICPLRILPPMNVAISEVARESGIPLIDAQALFESHSRDGIVGDQWLLDHVHPSIEGHQLLADALADKLVEMQVVSPGPDWAEVRQVQYQEHLESLPDLYFLKGMQQLEALQRWSQGRGVKLRESSQE